MPLNIDLLKRVRDHIVAHPQNFDMNHYMIRNTDCGTVCCIGGRAWLLSCKNQDEPYPKTGIALLARQLLALSVDEAGVLFYANQWPPDYKHRYLDCKTTSETSIVAAEYIDHILKLGYVPTNHLQ